MRVFPKTCEICGKDFISFTTGKKYCSKECSYEARERKREGRGQLCWRCKKACGGCSWSDWLKPVEGWTATPTVVKDFMGDFESYKIKKCPEFVADEEDE